MLFSSSYAPLTSFLTPPSMCAILAFSSENHDSWIIVFRFREDLANENEKYNSLIININYYRDLSNCSRPTGEEPSS
ncbi:hypothetical protein ES703_120593 [subsurface metagenome]